MLNLETLKLASDIFLSLAVLYLGFRTVRGGAKTNLHELRVLDQSLKSLIDEATHASRALNEQLLRRQENLEKLLFDINSAEGKAHRATEAAEDRRASLQTGISKAERLMDELSQVRANPIRATSEPEILPEPIVVRQIIEKEATPIKTQPAAIKLNIYGEPIQASENQPPPKRERAYVPLAAQVERQINPQTAKQDIQAIFSQAERMIRAGEDLATVSAQTKLSKRDIDMLSQLVESEERTKAIAAPKPPEPAPELEEEERSPLLTPEEALRAKTRDPRLGILGAQIKRQVQVL